MNAFLLPSRIVQTISFVPAVSMDPRSRITARSLAPRNGTISSASPSTAMLALCVAMMTWRCSLMLRRECTSVL